MRFVFPLSKPLTRPRQDGFTLVEVLVAISIIGIMASRSSPMRSEIAIKYERLYGNAEFKRGRGMKLRKLKEDITENLEGEFGEVCRDMFQDGDERGADYCFLAMHGSSKDEKLKAKGIAIDDVSAAAPFASSFESSRGSGCTGQAGQCCRVGVSLRDDRQHGHG